MRSGRLSGLQVVSNKSFSSSPQVGGKSWFRNMACADPQWTLTLPPNRLRVHGVSWESMAEEGWLNGRWVANKTRALLVYASRRLPCPKVGERLLRVLTVSRVQPFLAAMDGRSRPERRDRFLFQLTHAEGFGMRDVAGGVGLVEVQVE